MAAVQTQQEILSYIATHKRRLRGTYRLNRIALIGSFARNEQTAESDIDIIVRFEENTPGLHELKERLKSELETTFGRRVDIVSEKYIKPYYRSQILRDAIYV